MFAYVCSGARPLIMVCLLARCSLCSRVWSPECRCLRFCCCACGGHDGHGCCQVLTVRDSPVYPAPRKSKGGVDVGAAVGGTFAAVFVVAVVGVVAVLERRRRKLSKRLATGDAVVFNPLSDKVWAARERLFLAQYAGTLLVGDCW
jgi:hypothetical protein